MNKNLAVIPARSGSTRLKNKNIYPLAGKPLIRWITEAVLDSNCFDTIIISTDSKDIFNAVSDLNVIHYDRPSHLATTKATVLEAMVDLIHNVEKHETFSYFLPTCPFVCYDDICQGMDFLYDADSVISMTKLQDTLQLACLMDQDKVFPVYDNLEQGLTNSKFIKTYYKPSGAFYMAGWDYLLRYKNFFVGDVKGVLIPPRRSVDINTIEDIYYAEAILKEAK